MEGKSIEQRKDMVSTEENSENVGKIWKKYNFKLK